ncbi:MAG: hypothetical protein RLY43_2144 [Bacteroidota bacterium]|jgi:hypothetical protein
MKKTCSTCENSGLVPIAYNCHVGKWLICKHSDRGNAAHIIKSQPDLKGKLSRTVSYWKKGELANG